MSTKQGVRTLEASFWTKLDQDIKNISRKTNDNLKKFKKQPPNLSIKESSKDNLHHSLKITDTQNNLRNKESIEKMRLKSLNNRLNYLQIRNHKQQKAQDIARKKYQSIKAIRQSNFSSKEQNKKKISLQQNANYQKAKQCAQQVKQERAYSLMHRQQWKDNIRSQANNMRSIRNQYKTIVIKRLEEDTNLKRSKVRKLKEQQSLSSSRLSQITTRKVQMGHQTYRQRLFHHYKEISSITRINKRLSAKLQNAITNGQNKSKSNNLEQYRQLLGLPKHQPTNTKNFYITNL